MARVLFSLLIVRTRTEAQCLYAFKPYRRMPQSSYNSVMLKNVIRAGLLAAGILAMAALAQEGHPLAGTWHGDWGPSATQRTPVVIFMKWETRILTGMLNPGPNAVPLKIATVEPTKWAVHLEADMKDAKGAAVPVVIDGTIGDIGSYNRTLSGTWMQGTAKGTFKLRRD